ncbi:hypothetical protein QUF61_13010 [Candidatus Venteria ishoeyi]|uniref:hypothetical protein n=1 Tax=Candidatus Venteria ishoeyi TaxID=1899563 RepID=UPI0025A66516|nr:hypothetical protein [Candidatus Venteria ishoeyi]MDM8547408.1 hypothetical protein [Candidatus Venteria ishoeyi]
MSIEKGLKQSIEQGIEQGVEQTTLNIVRNAHQIGLPLSTIEEISGLPEKQITGLLKADADKQK